MRGLSEQVILLHAKGNSIWVPVRRLQKLAIRDASSKDVIKVHVRGDHVKNNVDPKLVKGSGVVHVVVPEGKIMIERLKGESAITVLAYSRRFTRAIEANGRHGVRADDETESEPGLTGRISAPDE